MHFKLEDVRTAVKLMEKHCFMATVDLKNAYFLLPVCESDRKYLRFLFKDKLYEFQCLPFGLNTAPFAFTKLMKPVIHCLRSKGLLSVIYLDDILCIGNDAESCRNNINVTCGLLEQLGFIINTEKSCLLPSTTCKFLGFVLNSENMTLNLPNEKRISIYDHVVKFLKKDSCKIREFAKLIGILVSSCPAVEYGWLYTKILESFKTQALFYSRDNFNATLSLNKQIKDDLHWWKCHIHSSYLKIKKIRL